MCIMLSSWKTQTEKKAGESTGARAQKKNCTEKKKKASTRLKNSAIALKQVRHSIFMSISGDIAIFGGKLSFFYVLKCFDYENHLHHTLS